MSALKREEQKLNYRVRAARRDGRIVLVKFCPGCGKEKVCSNDRKESDFFVASKGSKANPTWSTTWRRYCKECSRRIHMERMASDPKYAEQTRARGRRGKRRALADPKKREQIREKDREYQRKRRSTPEGRAYVRESARLAYALRREREGRPLKQRKTVIDDTHPRLPAGPFREWLLEYACMTRFVTEAEDGSVEVNEQELARDLSLVPRRVRAVLGGEQQNVTVDVVDRALIEARFLVEVGGRVIATLDDLYGEA